MINLLYYQYNFLYPVTVMGILILRIYYIFIYPFTKLSSVLTYQGGLIYEKGTNIYCFHWWWS